MLTRSARIRQELGYPVIDGDGHIVELLQVFNDFVIDNGRSDLVERMMQRNPWGPGAVAELSRDERRQAGFLPSSWHVPASTDYYATVASPRRYYDRIGEAGIDFVVMYPTLGINYLQILDEDERVTICRLYNEYMQEQLRPYADKIAMVALIPMHTPDEAIAALEHAKGLGAKVGLIASHVHRGVPGQPWPPDDPWAGQRIPEWEVNGWVDTFGLDSAYDYDPVWAKAIELGMPLSAHTAGIGFNDRASTSNFVYNQVGHFAASGHALAKALVLGGVLHRFPDLRLALLEGGVAVGVETFVGLVTCFEKRSGAAIKALNPELIDRAKLAELLVDADPRLAKYAPEQLIWAGRAKEMRDDFAATGVSSVEELRDQYTRSFFWGCEADDPFVGLAYDERILPAGAKIRPFFASDLGHWDVPDFDMPLHEAYELIEDGILNEDQFREFVFENPVKFYAGPNPDFFTGTAIERECKAVLASG